MKTNEIKLEITKMQWMIREIQKAADEILKQVEHYEMLKNQTPVDDLDLTIRTNNILKGEHIFTVEQLVGYTDEQLIRMPLIGRKALNEIKEVLMQRGLKLKGEQ